MWAPSRHMGYSVVSASEMKACGTQGLNSCYLKLHSDCVAVFFLGGESVSSHPEVKLLLYILFLFIFNFF